MIFKKPKMGIHQMIKYILMHDSYRTASRSNIGLSRSDLTILGSNLGPKHIYFLMIPSLRSYSTSDICYTEKEAIRHWLEEAAQKGNLQIHIQLDFNSSIN